MRQTVHETEQSWLLQQLNNPSSERKLTDRQSKYQKTYKGLMAPSNEALLHPPAPLLMELATLGCKADVGEAWTMDMLETAINKGAHPSSLQPDAAGQLRAETLEKVDQGYAQLVPWDDIKSNPPKNLKISPIAAIPHKSRGYRMILDLLHGVRMGKTIHPSVNKATNPKVAPTAAMAELGNVLPRLIYTVANADEAQGPILFSKLDIKDGYWRMVVPANDEWNFAYILPNASPDERTQLVVPSSLQMGWRDSPAYFCAASEMARDVGKKLATSTPIGFLPPHPLEHWLIHPNEWPANDETARKGTLYRLLKVYVDDLIHLAQTTNAIEL
jgi:hypothetical protein